MLCQTVFLVFLLQKLSWAADKVADKQKQDEELYRKLFMTEHQRKFLDKDVMGAKRAFVQGKDLEMSFISPNDNEVVRKLVNVEEGEAVTEEAIQVPRFNTLEEAKEAFRSPKVHKQREDHINYLKAQHSYIEEQKNTLMRPVLDAISSVVPYSLYGALSYVDPLISMRSAEYYQDEVEKVEYEMLKRDKFIDEHPKWFLTKSYFNKDLFGLERTLKKVEKKGEGVTVLVIDSFTKILPLALKGKCKNADKFDKALEEIEEKERKNHGVAVASIVLDDEVGVAPDAHFTAVSVTDYFPFFSDSMENAPLSTNYFIEFSGNSIEPHHLVAIDFFLTEKGARFSAKVSDTHYHIIDAGDKDLPKEDIINMSLSYMDSIGESRNSKYPKETLVQLVGFATMVLRFVQAGKMIVWASGNGSMVQGQSTSYTLMKALTEFKPASFINALALSPDGTTLSDFTNQPGAHSINNYSLSAPGQQVTVMNLDGSYRKGSGTSYAAPYITGAAALLSSNYPEASMSHITKALLYMAAPVVMRPSPSRRGETPVVIRSGRSGSLKPGTHTYMNPRGQEKEIKVTQEMIDRGREKYGVGIINISGACTLLEMNKTNPETVKHIINKPF